MSYDTDKLYSLLPAIYRIKDSEQDDVLRTFLSVLAEQAVVIEEDIARLYDNWFIETCEEWVVPYIGDLLRVRNLHPFIGKAAFSQRARVANTLRYRRRKGTATMLEQLAHDITGWDARVVEFFKLLNTTQYLNHVRLDNPRSIDLRDNKKLELLDTPFDGVTHTADVRHIESRRGKYNISNIGIYLWRLQAYPVRLAQAFSHSSPSNGRFSFSQLGNDMQLFCHPETEQNITHLAEENNVPAPIRRRAFFASKELYYGKDKSIYLWIAEKEVTPEEIDPCNLSEWKHVPPFGKIAIDPVLGRIAFPDGVLPSDVRVSYYYGFSSEVGGGFFDRRTVTRQQRENVSRYDISKLHNLRTIKEALDKWEADYRPAAIFYIKDSETYDEKIKLEFVIPAGITLEIRAENEERPVIRLTDTLTIKGETASKDQQGGQMILDGLLIAGSSIEILNGDLRNLQILNSTLVPGLDLNTNSTPKFKGQDSLFVEGENLNLDVSLTRSITGGINLNNINYLFIEDSIVDGLEGSAIKGPTLVIKESTVLGSVSVKAVKLGSNSIFTGKVAAERKQEGCMRFCFFPYNSNAPRQYHCQPHTAIHRAVKKEFEAALSKKPGMTPERQEQLEEQIRKLLENEIMLWLKPVFTDLRYSRPGYAQLHFQCPEEIRSGADDEAEMGVFHHLQQPQREANLRTSLEEYLRVGLEAGIFYIT